MKKLIQLLTILFLLLSLVSCKKKPVEDVQKDIPEGAIVFEDGYKMMYDHVPLVNLHGNWYDMGRQYGALMKDELNAIYYDLIYENIKDDPETLNKIADKSDTVYYDYPFRFKEFFEGASETSELSVEQLKILNNIERIYSYIPQCSCLMVNEEYTTDGKMVIGRNYDFDKMFRKFKDYVTVTIYQPADGALATATIGYLGEIYAVNGMNEAGIFMELNSGTFSSKDRDFTRFNSLPQLLSMLLDADNIDYVDKFFMTNNNSSSYLMGIADTTIARCYEWCVYGVKRGDLDQPEHAVSLTNNFINPEWNIIVEDDETNISTNLRRENLLLLAEANKGQIDDTRMQEIISTPFEDGGALNYMTVYELVAVPEDLLLYVNVIDGSSWQKIDLAYHFEH